MTIEEMKKNKSEIEKLIAMQIGKFEKDTNTKIAHIQIHRGIFDRDLIKIIILTENIK